MDEYKVHEYIDLENFLYQKVAADSKPHSIWRRLMMGTSHLTVCWAANLDQEGVDGGLFYPIIQTSNQSFQHTLLARTAITPGHTGSRPGGLFANGPKHPLRMH